MGTRFTFLVCLMGEIRHSRVLFSNVCKAGIILLEFCKQKAVQIMLSIKLCVNELARGRDRDR